MTPPRRLDDPVMRIWMQLRDLGRGDVSVNTLERMWKAFEGALQERVGDELMRNMTLAQLAEFRAHLDADPTEIERWLEAHCPDFRTIVRNQLDAAVDAAVRWIATTVPRPRGVQRLDSR